MMRAVCEEFAMGEKLNVITGLLHWILGPGQKLTEALDYAPLPKAVEAKEEKAISKVHGK